MPLEQDVDAQDLVSNSALLAIHAGRTPVINEKLREQISCHQGLQVLGRAREQLRIEFDQVKAAKSSLEKDMILVEKEKKIALYDTVLNHQTFERESEVTLHAETKSL